MPVTLSGKKLKLTGNKVVITKNRAAFTIGQTAAFQSPTGYWVGCDISANGSYGIASHEDGEAWVFNRSGNTWAFQQELSGSAGDDYGSDCHIDFDGNVAIVGARSGNDAYVYKRTTGSPVWSLDATLSPVIPGNDQLGRIVRVSADGTRVFIVDPVHDGGGVTNNSGRIVTYTDIGSPMGWVLEKSLEDDDPGAPYSAARFGRGMGLGSNESKFVTYTHRDGQSGGGTTRGRIYEYNLGGSPIWFKGSTRQLDVFDFTIGSGNNNTTNFAVSYNNGTDAVLGVSDFPNDQAYLILKSGGSWSAGTQNLIPTGGLPGTIAGSSFGKAISMNEDGTKIAVSAITYDDPLTDCGAVFLFNRSGTTITYDRIIQPDTPIINHSFGQDLSMSPDGKKLMVISNGEFGVDPGFVYFFNI